MQLGAHARVFAVQVAVAIEADVAAEPAVSEDRPQGIIPVAQLLRDVVGAVIDTLAIVRPAGGEVIIADAPAIQRCV